MAVKQSVRLVTRPTTKRVNVPRRILETWIERRSAALNMSVEEYKESTEYRGRHIYEQPIMSGSGKGRRNPYQFSRAKNPSYIPKWLAQKYAGMLERGEQPEISWDSRVAAIIPLRNSQEHVNTLLDPLYAQTVGCTPILVANERDQTWSGINPARLIAAGIPYELDKDGKVVLTGNPEFYDEEFLGSPVTAQVWRGTNLILVEVTVPKNWKGRDTNLKRNVGGVLAAYFGYEFLFYTDAKIVRDPDWVEFGLTLMWQEQIYAVAGVMKGTEKSSQSFWGIFTDKNYITRNPKFGEGFVLTRDNFGAGESLPITATFAMSVVEFVRMGGFDIRFSISYEDYSAAWRLVYNGGRIYCTGRWVVWHKHREGLRKIWLEYIRSGGGAAMLAYYYPECGFATRRIRQVAVVATAFILSLSGLISLVLLHQDTILLAGVIVLASLVIAAGSGMVLKVRYARAFVFPILTVLFIFAFSLGFLIQYIERGGGERIMQSMWLVVRSW